MLNNVISQYPILLVLYSSCGARELYLILIKCIKKAGFSGFSMCFLKIKFCFYLKETTEKQQ